MSTFGTVVREPSGRPLSGKTAMRPSSSCSTRLLNAVLKPRTLIPTDMMPVWMKSTPFTCLSAAPNELPTAFSMSLTSRRVTVAGASVTFSVRRDAETTTPRPGLARVPG